MGNSVQFRSSSEAIKAWENTDCEAWSLWQGKELLFKGIGSNDLREILNMIEESEISAAAYRICYYEEITDRKKINNKTPYDGSFSFVINSEGVAIMDARRERLRGGGIAGTRLAAVEEKLDRLLEGPAPETERENKLGMIGEILEHPTIAQILPLLMQKFFGVPVSSAAVPIYEGARINGPVPQTNNSVNLGAVADLPPLGGQGVAVLPSVAESIGKLANLDPKLKERIFKIAWAAENDQISYNALMGAIDSYAIPG